MDKPLTRSNVFIGKATTSHASDMIAPWSDFEDYCFFQRKTFFLISERHFFKPLNESLRIDFECFRPYQNLAVIGLTELIGPDLKARCR